MLRTIRYHLPCRTLDGWPGKIGLHTMVGLENHGAQLIAYFRFKETNRLLGTYYTFLDRISGCGMADQILYG